MAQNKVMLYIIITTDISGYTHYQLAESRHASFQKAKELEETGIYLTVRTTMKCLYTKKDLALWNAYLKEKN